MQVNDLQHPDRTLRVNKPDWDWEFLRRALHEQARHRTDRDENQRGARIYRLSQDMFGESPKLSLSLSEWKLIVEELDDYSTHLKYGYSEQLAAEYQDYAAELATLIDQSDGKTDDT